MSEIDELRKAIEALEAQRLSLGNEVVDTALAPLREKLAALEGYKPTSRQRRLVTILFLDIVNSTSLSQGLEPEEVQEIIGGALKRLSIPADNHGGQITEFFGDGFVAVFGLSKVRENDARQAVRAGLDILNEASSCAEDLDHYHNLIGFSVRIGINTGRVVEGQFTKAESPLMGLTVSLAARLEQFAQPGCLYISEFTYQHVRGGFEVNPLPALEAKGFRQPIKVYQVLSARPRTFRTFTRGVEGIDTELIGRENELQRLKASFERTINDPVTQLVTIIGEAGVGKSRVLYEFDRWIAHIPHSVIVFKARASPQMMSVSFGMLRMMISYHLGLLTTDSLQLTHQRLMEELSHYFPDETEMRAHFIGSLLGFVFSDSPYLQAVENNPKQLRERAQRYLIQYFKAITRQSTSIIMLDDIHWADDYSVRFISQLVADCPQLPLLVVCLARPTYRERFPDWAAVETADQDITIGKQPASKQTLTLEPLSRQASIELLDEILRNVDALPIHLRNTILDNADGNPFFLEEYIQSLVDKKVIYRKGKDGYWKLDHERLSNIELPGTLIALLESRLDNLSPTQRTLLLQASVVGRVFWRIALQAMRQGEPAGDEELQELCKRGFIDLQESSTFEGTEEYRFHHALLRDVAYQALIKSDRQTYHNQVASWLIDTTQAFNRAGEFAPIIAEHFESAGMQDPASDWYVQSARRARNQGDPNLARRFYDRALTLLPPGSDSTHSEQRRLWHVLAGRDEVLGILGDSEARIADDMALVTLADSIGDDHLIAEAFYRRSYYLGKTGEYLEEREACILGLEAARRVQDLRCEALILGSLVNCEIRLGDIQSAAQTAALALKCAEELNEDEVMVRTLANLSNFYIEVGDWAHTVQLLNRQLEINRKTGYEEGEMVGLSNLGYTYLRLGMFEEAVSTLKQAIKMSKDIGHRIYSAYGNLNLAMAYIRLQDLASALSILEKCSSEMQTMKDVFGCAVCHTYMALAMESQNQIQEALDNFQQAADSLRQMSSMGNVCDAQAGMARCFHKLNDLQTSQQYASRVWEYLQQQAGAGMEFLLLGYETCAEVFHAVGRELEARQVVEAGYVELMKQVERINGVECRQSFLERIPEHKHIQALQNSYTKINHVKKGE